jgi:hypothetical protein
MYVTSPDTIKFESSNWASCYFDKGFDSEYLIKTAEQHFNAFDIEVDSFVGLGLSSLIAVPVLAYHFKVPFLALRKPGVSCHDSQVGMIGRGTIGKRWMFIDDFKATGRTIENAKSYVTKGLDYMGVPETATKYVGTFTYNDGGAFITPDNEVKHVKELILDGHSTIVDGSMYDYFRTLYYDAMDYARKDPKGYAITKFNASGKYSVDLKTLSAMAVEVEKVYKAIYGG